jgi:hypothetical protein
MSEQDGSLGVFAPSWWNPTTVLAPKAPLFLAKYRQKLVTKCRSKLRALGIHLRQQLHISLHLDLNLDLNFYLHSSLLRALFAKSYKS